jgi:hypothetical protein
LSCCACPDTGGLHHLADGEHEPLPAAYSTEVGPEVAKGEILAKSF